MNTHRDRATAGPLLLSPSHPVLLRPRALPSKTIDRQLHKDAGDQADQSSQGKEPDRRQVEPARRDLERGLVPAALLHSDDKEASRNASHRKTQEQETADDW